MKSIIEFSENLCRSIRDFEDVFGVRAMKLEGKIKKIIFNQESGRWACQLGDARHGSVWVSLFLNERVPADLRETVQSLKVGDEVEIDAYKSKDGRWLNIKNIIPFKQISEKQEEEPPFDPYPYLEPEELDKQSEQGEQVSLRDVLISRQVALKSAVEWATAQIQIGQNVSGDSICKVAQMFEEYILRR